MKEVNLTDEELYDKINFLRSEDELLGCYFEGHCDAKQWERVAKKFLEHEGIKDFWRTKQEVRKGYYKTVPQRDGRSIFVFFSEPCRGATAIMEMQYL